MIQLSAYSTHRHSEWSKTSKIKSSLVLSPAMLLMLLLCSCAMQSTRPVVTQGPEPENMQQQTSSPGVSTGPAEPGDLAGPADSASKFAQKAKIAIENEQFREALTSIRKAIAIRNTESQYYELHGLALVGLNRAQDALQAFDRAVALNANDHSPLLQRGLLKYRLKSFGAAETDLLLSLKLQPTQEAYHALGQIAVHQHNCRLAIYFYREAMAIASGNIEELNNKVAALELSCP